MEAFDGFEGAHVAHPAQSEASSHPTFATMSQVRLFPSFDAPGSRVTKDAHAGSHAALMKATKNQVPFTDKVRAGGFSWLVLESDGMGSDQAPVLPMFQLLQVHKRTHVRLSGAFGSNFARDRQPLLEWYDRNVRQPHKDIALAELNLIHTQHPGKLEKLMGGEPLECLLPVARHFPTGNRGRSVVVGPMHDQVTSNEAEMTMKMMLAARGEADLGVALVILLQARRRRYMTVVEDFRSAQQADVHIADQLKGLTPYVRAAVQESFVTARACTVQQGATATTFFVSSSMPGAGHRFTVHRPTTCTVPPVHRPTTCIAPPHASHPIPFHFIPTSGGTRWTLCSAATSCAQGTACARRRRAAPTCARS